MKISVNTSIDVDIEKIAENMSEEELAELLHIVAHRFDDSYKSRKTLADALASGTSEVGARFLAEVISSTIYR